MNRALGLDVGDKTIGVAVSDPFYMMAQGLTTIRRTTLESDLNELVKIVEEQNIDIIVIGLPKNMNNTIGPQGEKVLDFYNILKTKVSVENIILQDERLTTVSAERMLINQNIRRDKRKVVIDMVAATYILQTFLDKRSHNGIN